MKIRRLPEIDLARIAPLQAGERRRQLEQHKAGRPPFSYDPLRQTIHDVINVTPDLFGPAEATPWPKVEQLIWRRSKSEDEYNSNIVVACTPTQSRKRFARGSRKYAHCPSGST